MHIGTGWMQFVLISRLWDNLCWFTESGNDCWCGEGLETPLVSWDRSPGNYKCAAMTFWMIGRADCRSFILFFRLSASRLLSSRIRLFPFASFLAALRDELSESEVSDFLDALSLSRSPIHP